MFIGKEKGNDPVSFQRIILRSPFWVATLAHRAIWVCVVSIQRINVIYFFEK